MDFILVNGIQKHKRILDCKKYFPTLNVDEAQADCILCTRGKVVFLETLDAQDVPKEEGALELHLGIL